MIYQWTAKKTQIFILFIYMYIWIAIFVYVCHTVLLFVFMVMDGESRSLCLSHFTLVLAVTELCVTSFFEMEDELYPVLLKSEMNTFYYLKEPLY